MKKIQMRVDGTQPKTFDCCLLSTGEKPPSGKELVEQGQSLLAVPFGFETRTAIVPQEMISCFAANNLAIISDKHPTWDKDPLYNAIRKRRK